MLQLIVTRVYEVAYDTGNGHRRQDRWSEEELRDARSVVLSAAVRAVREPTTSIDWSVQHPARLSVTITTTEEVTSHDQVTVSLLHAVQSAIDEALVALGWAIRREASEAHADEGSTSDSIYDGTGLAESWWHDSRHLMDGETRPLKVIVSAVTIPVTPAVAAAIRTAERREVLVRSAVIDHNAARGLRTPLLGCSLVLQSGALRIESHSDEAEDVAGAVIEVPIGRPSRQRVIDGWPPASAPYWAAGTLALAALAIAVSAAPITALWLAATVVTMAAVVTAAVALAWRNGASGPRTLLGMAPATLVITFAVIYGLFALGDPPSVLTPAGDAHLVDVLLLALGVASTGGFMDLGLHGEAVRIAALIEMLLMVSVAGGSLYAASRAVWNRLADLVRREG